MAADFTDHPVSPPASNEQPKPPGVVPPGADEQPGQQPGAEPLTAHEWANKRLADVLGERPSPQQPAQDPPAGPGPYSGEIENEDADPVGKPPRL